LYKFKVAEVEKENGCILDRLCQKKKYEYFFHYKLLIK